MLFGEAQKHTVGTSFPHRDTAIFYFFHEVVPKSKHTHTLCLDISPTFVNTPKSCQWWGHSVSPPTPLKLYIHPQKVALLVLSTSTLSIDLYLSSSCISALDSWVPFHGAMTMTGGLIIFYPWPTISSKPSIITSEVRGQSIVGNLLLAIGCLGLAPLLPYSPSWRIRGADSWSDEKIESRVFSDFYFFGLRHTSNLDGRNEEGYVLESILVRQLTGWSLWTTMFIIFEICTYHNPRSKTLM